MTAMDNARAAIDRAAETPVAAKPPVVDLMAALEASLAAAQAERANPPDISGCDNEPYDQQPGEWA